MAREVRADPDALIVLAGACLAAADDLGANYRTGLADLSPPADAFGSTAASDRAARVAQRLQADAQDAVRAHVQVLESDADRLIQAAFAYAAADRSAGRRLAPG